MATGLTPVGFWCFSLASVVAGSTVGLEGEREFGATTLMLSYLKPSTATALFVSDELLNLTNTPCASAVTTVPRAPKRWSPCRITSTVSPA